MLQHALRFSLLAVVLGFVAQDAHAFGRCGGWGRGCGGGYGGCGYGYGGYGYGGGYYGGYGYGGGYGGYGGWGYGGWGYNGGYYGGNSSLASTTQLASDSAFLTVTVPADAKVLVNGLPTKSTGESRRFTSTGLQLAALYPYRVRAEYMRDGKLVTEEKTIGLIAGQTASLVFDVPPAPAPAPKVADVGAPAQR